MAARWLGRRASERQVGRTPRWAEPHTRHLIRLWVSIQLVGMGRRHARPRSIVRQCGLSCWQHWPSQAPAKGGWDASPIREPRLVQTIAAAGEGPAGRVSKAAVPRLVPGPPLVMIERRWKAGSEMLGRPRAGWAAGLVDAKSQGRGTAAAPATAATTPRTTWCLAAPSSKLAGPFVLGTCQSTCPGYRGRRTRTSTSSRAVRGRQPPQVVPALERVALIPLASPSEGTVN
eukprot:s3403_g10.t1